jgi:hypothetical protein
MDTNLSLSGDCVSMGSELLLLGLPLCIDRSAVSALPFSSVEVA